MRCTDHIARPTDIINDVIGRAIAKTCKLTVARMAGLNHTVLRPFGTPRWNPEMRTLEKLYAAARAVLSENAADVPADTAAPGTSQADEANA